MADRGPPIRAAVSGVVVLVAAVVYAQAPTRSGEAVDGQSAFPALVEPTRGSWRVTGTGLRRACLLSVVSTITALEVCLGIGSFSSSQGTLVEMIHLSRASCKL